MERVEKRYGIRRVEIVATVGWVREIGNRPVERAIVVERQTDR